MNIIVVQFNCAHKTICDHKEEAKEEEKQQEKK